MQLAVGDLRHCAVVGLEDDRHLLRVAVGEVAVEAVVRDVELAVVEPLEEGRVRLVERPRERLVPQDLVPRELRPEAGEVLRRAGVHRLEVRLLDIRLRDEFARRLEDPAFVRYRLDRGHAFFSSKGMPPMRSGAGGALDTAPQSNQTRTLPAIRRLDAAQSRCGSGRRPRPRIGSRGAHAPTRAVLKAVRPHATYRRRQRPER